MLNERERALIERFGHDDPATLLRLGNGNGHFEAGVARASGYVLTLMFEVLLLGAIWLWIVLLFDRSESRLARALAWLVLPLLFMIPSYLGYASTSYTSAGPSGGVVYPFLIRAMPGRSLTPWWDWVFLEHAPPVFAPLSTAIGPFMSLSGRGIPGPMVMLGLGVVLAAVFVGGPILFRRAISGPASAEKKPTLDS
ncbi:MAG: hypothetical protein AAGB29_00445 [Planctomycetota bacterium]